MPPPEPRGTVPAMFRLVRLLFLLVAAFVAGFFYAEMTRSERCVELGGTVQGGLCLGGAE